MPDGDACGCFDLVDEVGGGDGLLPRYAVISGKVGRLLDDLVLLKCGTCCVGCGDGGCCRLSHLFIFFGASGSVTQIQANLFKSQKELFRKINLLVLTRTFVSKYQLVSEY